MLPEMILAKLLLEICLRTCSGSTGGGGSARGGSSNDCRRGRSGGSLRERIVDDLLLVGALVCWHLGRRSVTKAATLLLGAGSGADTNA